MIKSCILLLMFSHCSNSNRIEDVFNLDADDIFASEYGDDFYEARKRLQSIPYKSFNMNDTMNLMSLIKKNATNLKLNTTTKAPDISTTERILMATISPGIAAEFQNTSLRDIKKHRLKLQLDRILSRNRSITDYLTNADVETLTRRFDQSVKEKVTPKTRRELYKTEEYRIVKWEAKKHLLNLMTHFVYISRYKLVYPQLLRKKYLNSFVYKLGFLFALLRHLKNMQKWLYHVLKKNGESGGELIGTLFYDFKLVEKLQRLDIDIKDVVLLIQKMEYRANIAYNPNFYEYTLET